jgi:hypothetical protein
MTSGTISLAVLPCRQAKGGTTNSGLGQIVDTISIRERPADADDRSGWTAQHRTPSQTHQQENDAIHNRE